MPNGVLHELRKLYYDTASATLGASMAALLKLATPQHILFGRDYPFATTRSCAETFTWDSSSRISAKTRSG
jgi:hypothetical protein